MISEKSYVIFPGSLFFTRIEKEAYLENTAFTEASVPSSSCI